MITTDQQKVFIRAICEEPFNNMPREAYTDWLMEQTDYIAPYFSYEGRILFLHTYTTTAADWLAHGPTLVTQHPITRVKIVDKEPWSINQGTRVFWLISLTKFDPHEYIPAVWFKRLKVVVSLYELTESYAMTDTFTCVDYATVEEAHDDLSRACIDWARAEAELSKLDWSKKR